MRVLRVASCQWPEWDDFVAAHPLGWFWHTRAWLAYQRAYRPSNVDESFAVTDEVGHIVAVVPLIVSVGAGRRREFTFSGAPTPDAIIKTAGSPVAVAEVIDGEMGKIAAPYSVSMGAWSGWATDPEAVATSLRRQRVIDLTRGSESLWREVRRSYRSLIHRAERAFRIRSSDESSGAPLLYEALHRAVYNEPRPARTYALQREWVQDGSGLVVVAEDRTGVTVGGALWIIYKGSAYYASGAYAVDDVAHAVVWRSLLALASRGVTRAVMTGTALDHTDKERSVTHFKRGFGGVDVPVSYAEIRYDR